MCRGGGRCGVRPGGARVEDPGVPPLQGLAHSGPLGPELGAAGALDGGQPDGPSPRPWPVCHHPFQALAGRSWRRRTPGSSPTRGAWAQMVLAHPCCWWGAGNTRVAWRYHQRTKARPWCRCWCQVGGGGRVPSPSPPASSLSTSSRSTCHRQKRLAASCMGTRAGCRRAVAVVGEGGGAAPCRRGAHPSQSPTSRRALWPRPWSPFVLVEGGEGGYVP